MKQLGSTFLLTAVVTHMLGGLVAGSGNPADWPRLLFWTMVCIVAPCIALGISVVRGVLR